MPFSLPRGEKARLGRSFVYLAWIHLQRMQVAVKYSGVNAAKGWLNT